MKESNVNDWTFRMVQLDLARQMERPEVIRRFIDDASEFGFTTLALYLEGRIRTTVFPYPSLDESYSSEQMMEIVEYAATRNIEVLPIISTLGHAELFLRHEALWPAAELRGGKRGRFDTTEYCSFCPSSDFTYDFFASYFSDLAGIFPSEWVHIGCDEVWDMGICEACSRRLSERETLDDLYTNHVQRIYDIVRSLGKKVMMWDDFLEELPTVLDRLPTDIVQCVWQYDPLVDQTQTHFGRRRTDRRLAEYDKRGISYLIVPWSAQGVRNTETLTTYARQFRPVGGLLTMWEGDVIESQLPVMAYAGARWLDPYGSDDRKIGRRALYDLFGVDDSLLFEAVWTAVSVGLLVKRHTLREFLRGPLTQYSYERTNQARMFIDLLRTFQPLVKKNGSVLEALMNDLQADILQSEVQELLESFYHAWNGDGGFQPGLLTRGENLLQQMKHEREAYLERLEKRYPGSSSGVGCQQKDWRGSLINELEDFLRSVSTGGWIDTGQLVLRYALPDFYGWPLVRWEVQYRDSGEWHRIDESAHKPRDGDYGDCPFYSVRLPVSGERPVKRALIHVRGYGGIGLMHVEVRRGKVVQVVQEVKVLGGRVQGEECILENDTSTCWLGDPSTAEAFHNFGKAAEVSSIQINFENED